MSSKYIWVLALLLVGCQTIPTSTNNKTNGSETAQTVSESSTVVKAQSTTSKKPKSAVKPPLVELTPQQQENLWLRIAMQFKLEVPDDPSVDYYRDWYLKHPEHLQTVSKRAAPFLYMITTRIEERNLPLELALLPVVESAFDPFAYSYGSAAGLWQFVPITADRFGLERNYWYDGRRDVNASTDAALDYMTYLGNRFNGDWENAIAAYNSGGGRVSSAIRQNKKAGKPTDFFSLNLPKETRAYVPKLLALADILANQKAYGIQLPEIANKPVLTLVDPKEQLDLAIAAQYAGISVKELQSYNPGFNQWATSPTGPHSFLIPIDNAEQFEQQAAKNRGKGIRLIRYKVKSGDTLSVIAQHNQTTSKVIQKANGMTNSNIRIGQYLMVPKSTRNNQSYTLSAENRLAKTQSISRGKIKTNYTVKSGDSFWSIAKSNQVSIDALSRWNGMAPKDSLRIGQKLVIWQGSKSGTVIRTVYYNVRSGDTVGAIAQKFKVKTTDVLAWNDLNHKDYLKPGQKLKLYVDVTRVDQA
ncbi:lytic transglycosylase [Vibrio casei]|uniref:LysM peptidoglycan-binding domain-containing protein n=1 Tax=Vibrio casei TaxID=673372 RepID=A0A368LLS9_9VIBR|nr:LysM peptidoglycan-binding domain-containing protein [Vibrio casei]RCS72797.1 LysM peptidoglycan-binding domain-containing protein [Vibrio casei]SJN39108.1 Membrane-bound lytic murein transglycosylase D precursor [Vibrio casei]